MSKTPGFPPLTRTQHLEIFSQEPNALLRSKLQAEYESLFPHNMLSTADIQHLFLVEGQHHGDEFARQLGVFVENLDAALGERFVGTAK